MAWSGPVGVTLVALPRPVPLPPRISQSEIAAHDKLVATLGADSIWARYGAENGVAAE